MKTPHQIAEERYEFAALYASLSGELENILERKPAIWTQLRDTVKSDTACERLYQASADGIREMQIKLRLKSLEKQMSAARTMLDVMSAEARNQM